MTDIEEMMTGLQQEGTGVFLFAFPAMPVVVRIHRGVNVVVECEGETVREALTMAVQRIAQAHRTPGVATEGGTVPPVVGASGLKGH